LERKQNPFQPGDFHSEARETTLTVGQPGTFSQLVQAKLKPVSTPFESATAAGTHGAKQWQS
jgi:hypothetical protein